MLSHYQKCHTKTSTQSRKSAKKEKEEVITREAAYKIANKEDTATLTNEESSNDESTPKERLIRETIGRSIKCKTSEKDVESAKKNGEIGVKSADVTVKIGDKPKRKRGRPRKEEYYNIPCEFPG